MKNKTRILVRVLRDQNGNRTKYSAKAVIDNAGVMMYITKRTVASEPNVERGFNLAAADLAAEQGLLGEWCQHSEPVKGVRYYCRVGACACPPVAGRRGSSVCFEVLTKNTYSIMPGH